MKAVIPVAGIGTRLRPHTYSYPKPLIPVAGKPILAYIIEHLQDAGIEEFVFVVGYLGDKIIDFVKEKFPNLKAEFVFQNKREGLGHAILAAEKLIQNEPIIIVLGDTIVDSDINELLNEKTSTLGIKKVDDPRNFGVASLTKENFIAELVEKPSIPKSNLALVGVYKILETKKLIYSIKYLVENNIRTNDEFHLTDALNYMVKQFQVQIKAITINNWFDLGKSDILLETNAILLKKYKSKKNYSEQCINSIIIPPVYIAANAKVENSIIGPNVTIGENADINYCILKDSIIGTFTSLKSVHLNFSIIGNDAIIKGNTQSLNIGDNTEIDFRGH
tara:strand:- start:4296 stop:5297 length:1002 start_codon:yes stop_codon:yes gene_type:complete